MLYSLVLLVFLGQSAQELVIDYDLTKEDCTLAVANNETIGVKLSCVLQ